jgi:hypothetical protein
MGPHMKPIGKERHRTENQAANNFGQHHRATQPNYRPSLALASCVLQQGKYGCAAATEKWNWFPPWEVTLMSSEPSKQAFCTGTIPPPVEWYARAARPDSLVTALPRDRPAVPLFFIIDANSSEIEQIAQPAFISPRYQRTHVGERARRKFASTPSVSSGKISPIQLPPKGFLIRASTSSHFVDADIMKDHRLRHARKAAPTAASAANACTAGASRWTISSHGRLQPEAISPQDFFD